AVAGKVVKGGLIMNPIKPSRHPPSEQSHQPESGMSHRREVPQQSGAADDRPQSTAAIQIPLVRPKSADERDRTEHVGMSTATGIASPTIGKRPLYRLRVEQYEKMVEAAVFRPDERVELIEGLLVQKMTQNPPHAVTLDCLHERLRPLLPSGWRGREQKPIKLRDSAPEPDFVVVKGPLSRYARRHPRPSDIALVAEVADSTLAEDREDKGRMYARAHLPIYWIINLVHAQIEVYTQPKAGRTPAYRDCQIYGLDDSLPLVI